MLILWSGECFSKIYTRPVFFHFPMQTKKCTSILMTSMLSAEKSKPSEPGIFHQKIDPRHTVLEAPKTDTPPLKAEASQKKKEGTVKPNDKAKNKP